MHLPLYQSHPFSILSSLLTPLEFGCVTTRYFHVYITSPSPPELLHTTENHFHFHLSCATIMYDFDRMLCQGPKVSGFPAIVRAGLFVALLRTYFSTVFLCNFSRPYAACYSPFMSHWVFHNFRLPGCGVGTMFGLSCLLRM